jgi:hypothetical protein
MNLSSRTGGPLSDFTLDSLCSGAISLHEKFSNSTPLFDNDKFFKWQISKPSHLRSIIGFDHLFDIVHRAAARYLERLGGELPAGGKAVAWTAVHRNGDYHGPHTHTGELVVAVFYARVPSGSGELLLFDPRGSLPPFGRHQRIAVEAGQLVLFPAWLAHSATPTLLDASEGARVMFAFNLGSEELARQSMRWDELDFTTRWYLKI